MDTKQRVRGIWYPRELPAILGIDGAGIVEKKGKAVTRFKEEEETLAWTGGRGVDLAIDLEGKKTFFDSFGTVRHYGRIVTLLGPDPQHADWMEARLRNLTVAFELKPAPMFYDPVDQQNRYIEQGETMGKVVLLTGGG